MSRKKRPKKVKTIKHLSLIFSYQWQDVVRGKVKLFDHLEIVFKKQSFQNLNVSPKEYVKYWLHKDHHVNKKLLKITKKQIKTTVLGRQFLNDLQEMFI